MEEAVFHARWQRLLRRLQPSLGLRHQVRAAVGEWHAARPLGVVAAGSATPDQPAVDFDKILSVCAEGHHDGVWLAGVNEQARTVWEYHLPVRCLRSGRPVRTGVAGKNEPVLEKGGSSHEGLDLFLLAECSTIEGPDEDETVGVAPLLAGLA